MKTILTTLLLTIAATSASADIVIKETNRIIHSYTGDVITVVSDFDFKADDLYMNNPVVPQLTPRQYYAKQAAESMLKTCIGGLDGRKSCNNELSPSQRDALKDIPLHMGGR